MSDDKRTIRECELCKAGLKGEINNLKDAFEKAARVQIREFRIAAAVTTSCIGVFISILTLLLTFHVI